MRLSGYVAFNPRIGVRFLIRISQANAIKFWNFQPSTAAKINKLANQFWLAGILFSVTFGLLKVSSLTKLMTARGSLNSIQAGRLANETKQLQSGPWTEKGVEADRDLKLTAIAK